VRELFFYWRSREPAAAEAAMAEWQTELRRAHRHLDALLYRRAEDEADPAGAATLMEVYRGPGLDAPLERRLVEEGRHRLARWIDGPRKLEVFVLRPCR
jgi:hypothetical protein